MPTDDNAAEFVLTALPFRLKGYMPETTMSGPRGFQLHLYLETTGYGEKVVTVDVTDADAMEFCWHGKNITQAEQEKISDAIHHLVREAYTDL